MARVLLAGTGPYPAEPGAPISGPTIRVRQFAEPLVAAGHLVTLLLLEGKPRTGIQVEGIGTGAAVTPEMICDPARALAAVGRADFDSVLGVGSLMPAFAAARVGRHLDIPAWADLFGDPLAERHALESRMAEDPDPLQRDHIWKLYRETLLAADHFSTVSDRQAHAVAGMLLLLGRSHGALGVHNRIVPVPCGVPDGWLSPPAAFDAPEVLARRGVQANAPLVFIGGSWTPWLDEERMAAVVVRALELDERLRVVVQLGDAGSEEARSVRARFLDRVVPDHRRARLVTLESGEAREDSVLAACGAALLLDRPVPESFLGSRNRLLNYVRWGLLPVVSAHSEVAAELIGHGVALRATETDDAARGLVAAAGRDPAQRLADRVAGCQALASLTFTATMAPAVGWLASAPAKWRQRSRLGEQDEWAARQR